jgi:hypothetical protein
MSLSKSHSLNGISDSLIETSRSLFSKVFPELCADYVDGDVAQRIMDLIGSFDFRSSYRAMYGTIWPDGRLLNFMFFAGRLSASSLHRDHAKYKKDKHRGHYQHKARPFAERGSNGVLGREYQPIRVPSSQASLIERADLDH